MSHSLSAYMRKRAGIEDTITGFGDMLSNAGLALDPARAATLIAEQRINHRLQDQRNKYKGPGAWNWINNKGLDVQEWVGDNVIKPMVPHVAPTAMKAMGATVPDQMREYFSGPGLGDYLGRGAADLVERHQPLLSAALTSAGKFTKEHPWLAAGGALGAAGLGAYGLYRAGKWLFGGNDDEDREPRRRRRPRPRYVYNPGYDYE